MGAAYYVAVNTDAPDFDTTIDGKSLSTNSKQVDAIAASLGFRSLHDYFSISAEDARREMEVLLEIEDVDELTPEDEEVLRQLPPEAWFDAEHGLNYAVQVADYIRQHPESVNDADAVLNDLEQMKQVMTDTQERGLKWHFQVDY